MKESVGKKSKDQDKSKDKINVQGRVSDKPVPLDAEKVKVRGPARSVTASKKAPNPAEMVGLPTPTKAGRGSKSTSPTVKSPAKKSSSTSAVATGSAITRAGSTLKSATSAESKSSGKIDKASTTKNQLTKLPVTPVAEPRRSAKSSKSSGDGPGEVGKSKETKVKEQVADRSGVATPSKAEKPQSRVSEQGLNQSKGKQDKKTDRKVENRNAEGRTGSGRSPSARVAVEPVPAQLPSVQIEPTQRHPSVTAVKVFENAVLVFNKRQYSEAKSLFEDIIAKYPQEFEILARVNTYLSVCNQRLVRSTGTPEKPEELYDRGVIALNTGDYDQARSNFERALLARPNEAYIIYSLAATLLQLGEIDLTIENLQRAIMLQPRLRSQLINDSDFTELRENRQFLAMMGVTSPFDRLDPRK